MYQQVLDTYIGEGEDEIYEMSEHLRTRRAGPWILDPPGIEEEQGEVGLDEEVDREDVWMQEDNEDAPEGILRMEEEEDKDEGEDDIRREEEDNIQIGYGVYV